MWFPLQVLHIITHHLKKRGKHGLVVRAVSSNLFSAFRAQPSDNFCVHAQAAMNNMTNELMLLGVATLILLLFQRNISGICSELSFMPEMMDSQMRS